MCLEHFVDPNLIQSSYSALFYPLNALVSSGTLRRNLLEKTSAPMNSVKIEFITDIPGYRECQQLEREVWGHGMETVPYYIFHNMVNMGGVVVGARDTQSGALVGTGFGFIARADEERATWMKNPYYIYSEMLGVLPEYRNKNLAVRLKMAQRDFALERDYSLICWTFDPLLSRNANLNMNKLGGICRQYKVDYYGPMEGINKGLPSDRFIVEWWIDSPYVEGRIEHKHLRRSYEEWVEAFARVHEATYDREDALPTPVSASDLTADRATILVEIPPDLDQIKAADMELALAWRMTFREIAQKLLAQGYIVADFVTEGRGTERRSFYIWQRDFDMLKMISPQSP